jgi:Ca-activated chloride channel family protein
MSFLWPGFLALLGLIPIFIIGYVLLQRRKRKVVLRYSSLSLIKQAAPRSSWLRRHLPFALLMASLASLTVGISRPISIATVPTEQRTIIMAMDVSLSMCSVDVPPNRLQAAQTAAIQFIENERASTQIGIVAFAGFAEVIQTPTKDRTDLRQAVEGLVTGRRTAIGSAILKSIDAIAEFDPSVPPSFKGSDFEDPPAPMPKGSYSPHIIVLLTDGASNSGPEPIEAAQQAIDRGIRVYTIGFGTARGSEIPRCGQPLIGREPQRGGGNFQNGVLQGRFRRGIDEETLKAVAQMTDAEYYSAESTDELIKAFQDLPTFLIAKSEITEVSVFFATAGALLALLAMFLALRWQPLPG